MLELCLGLHVDSPAPLSAAFSGVKVLKSCAWIQPHLHNHVQSTVALHTQHTRERPVVSCGHSDSLIRSHSGQPSQTHPH
jgi:hypothetical protein